MFSNDAAGAGFNSPQGHSFSFILNFAEKMVDILLIFQKIIFFKIISDGYLGRPCSDFHSKCIKHLNLDEKIFSAAQVCTNGTRAIFSTTALTKHNRKNGQFRCFDR